ncbi:zinc ribbon domain-containing protein [Zongyangia hominis]|uniref:Zinc ribbon domain-containing protein n=1 Tax=Zongyangia hominis TaxID=2763677 RepID=A0A926ECW7_9FIRM|nr:zinc ribbon domain-containing protein [Zongyangia hominis]MBC8569811.1 zinc ribbon domain-containing protein [Zongyangia hominis]
MDMFDSFVNAAKDACDKAGKMTEEVVAISKLKLKCSQTKAEIEKAYGRLGKIVFDCKKSGVENDELVAVCVAEIQALIDQLEADTDQLMQLKKLIRCKSCGYANPIGSLYCNRCGAKLDPMPEPADEEEAAPGEEVPAEEAPTEEPQAPEEPAETAAEEPKTEE